MQIGLIGLNHKSAFVGVREKLASLCERRFGVGRSLHGAHACILLSTCNRMEIYFTSDDLAETHSYILQILRQEMEEEFEHLLYSYFGRDCFEHLARVTAGLDSAIIGETEIQGQVKNAYQAAINDGRVAKLLHFIFQKSLKIGKSLRQTIGDAPGLPNLEHSVYKLLKNSYTAIESLKVLFIGASEVNERVLRFLTNRQFKNLSICNRSYDNMRALAEKQKVNMLPWTEVGHWNNYDCVFVGTRYQGHLITAAEERGKSLSPTLIMDFSLPRNIDPALGDFSGQQLYNIDEVQQGVANMRRLRDEELYKAEEQLQEMLDRQMRTQQCQWVYQELSLVS